MRTIIDQVSGLIYTPVALTESATGNKRVLGQLKGPVCDYRESTRNGRFYPKKLWERVFNSPEFKEGIETKTMFGEADHPADRLEPSNKEAAVQLLEVHDVPAEGKYYGTFDILDTPNGRIIKTLCEYGSILGVSSRGGGDVIMREGRECVDEDSYVFMAFDVVTTPAVKSARTPEVDSGVATEGVKSSAKILCESLQPEIDSIDSKEQLSQAKSLLENSGVPGVDSLIESIDNRLHTVKEGDSVSSKLLEDLGNATTMLQSSKELNESLTNKLSASNTRVKELEEQVNTANTKIDDLMVSQDKLALLQMENKRLKESVSSYSSLKDENRRLRAQVSSLNDGLNAATKSNKQLTAKLESVSKSLNNSKISLKESIDTVSRLQKTCNEYSTKLSNEISMKNKLSESLKKSELDKRKICDNSKKIAESHNALMAKYISAVCKFSNLEESLVKSKLPKAFTSSDVDKTVAGLLDESARLKTVPINFKESINLTNVDTNKLVENKKDNSDSNLLLGMMKGMDAFKIKNNK